MPLLIRNECTMNEMNEHKSIKKIKCCKCGMAFSEDTSGWSEKGGAKDGETEGGV